MNSRTKSGIFLHSSFRDPACACVKTDPLDARRCAVFIYSPGREMTLRGLRSLVRPCFDFHDTRATAMFALPSGDDTSQWAQERLNRSKIGKAFAWE